MHKAQLTVGEKPFPQTVFEFEIKKNAKKYFKIPKAIRDAAFKEAQRLKAERDDIVYKNYLALAQAQNPRTKR